MRSIRITRDSVMGACISFEETPDGITLLIGEGRTEIALGKFEKNIHAVSFDLKLLKVPCSLQLCYEQQFQGGVRNGIWIEAAADGKTDLQAGMEPHDRLTLAYTNRPKTPLSGKEVKNLYPGTEAIEIGLGRSVPCLFSVDFGSGAGSIHYVAKIGERVFEYWGRNTQSKGGAEYLSASIILTASGSGDAMLVLSDCRTGDKPIDRSSLEKPMYPVGKKKIGSKREYCMMRSTDTDIAAWERDLAEMANMGLTHVCLVDTRYSAFTPDVFDLYDAAVKKAANQGLRSYFCVYTCGRPFMLGQKGFDAEPMVNGMGQKSVITENLWNLEWQEKGGLRNYLSEVARHYAGNPNVAGYIIDEPLREWIKAREQGYDPACRKQFVAFLRDKYQTLDRLNKDWVASFRTWEDVLPPTPEQSKELQVRWSDWQQARCAWSASFFVNVQKYLKEPDPTKKVIWSISIPSNKDATVKERENNCVDWDTVIPALDVVLFAVTVPGEGKGLDPALRQLVDRSDLKGKTKFTAHCWFSIHAWGGNKPSLIEARRRLDEVEKLFPDCHWYGWAYKQCGPHDMGLQDDLSLWPEYRNILSQFIKDCESRP